MTQNKTSLPEPLRSLVRSQRYQLEKLNETNKKIEHLNSELQSSRGFGKEKEKE